MGKKRKKLIYFMFLRILQTNNFELIKANLTGIHNKTYSKLLIICSNPTVNGFFSATFKL